MRLSRSGSVAVRRNDEKLRDRFKGKKKHKRLDAICEKAYNRSLQEARKIESCEFNDERNELELRRSTRARKAPELLDSSPPPPKKRRKVNRTGSVSTEKVRGKDWVKLDTPCSTSKNSDGQSGGWLSRLRFRENNTSLSGRKNVESSPRGKRKLFADLDEFRHDKELKCDDKKEGLLAEKSTVVRSKRPGRVKASNMLVDENGMEDDKEKNRNDVFEIIDEGDEVRLETKLKCSSEDGAKDECTTSDACERDETASMMKSQLEEYSINGNVETGGENLKPKIIGNENNITRVCSTADQAEDEGHPQKSVEDETCKNFVDHPNALESVYCKSRIKLGRRCGLCGGGNDGKPPKILLVDGTGSDNEVYSGSSASEEPNYDVWDGFGDDSGWLGRLLGPINDRFGIAGIWVHQQCAVWSPEVYFAGLGCLKNIRAALYRGRALKCNRCRRSGATIGCRVDRCPKTYHLPCARTQGCIFDHRKFLIACTDHRHIFQHGIPNALRLKKMKAKKMKLELRKSSNDAVRKDIEAEEKWLENCGEDEEFLKRESKRLHRDLLRIAPVYIGGADSDGQTHFQGWESVAGLQNVIQCMKEVVILPLLYPEFFNNMGLTPPRGVLLHGFPGTGKTLVVRALVGSCARGDKKIAYFARKGVDCLGKYVGDSERQLRLLFQVAEKSQPSIIFFDEIDGLAPCRSRKQDQTHSSVVSTLLALMDGLKSRGSVIVIGATNRPDAVDPALRRPGRFDREIYFPLPSFKDREAILSLHTQKWPKPITGSMLKWAAKQTVGFAGADLQALCTQAAIIALKRSFPLREVLSAAETHGSNSKCLSIPNLAVEERDWLQALSCAPPPCSRRDSGMAVNDVVSMPLSSHLVPCLLQPLVTLLVHLHLDEHIWLPPPLKKASTLLKDVIVTALANRRVQTYTWWLHIDDLLQEVNVTREIEKNLLLANVLVGETNCCSSDAVEETRDEGQLKSLSTSSHFLGTHFALLQNTSYTSCKKSGFQMLISGNPRSGQRHLASCLLHCFVGNVNVSKIDLASISHEGNGDMIQGLTQILMRCASTNLCMIYMPRIDLWGIQMYDKADEDDHEQYSLLEPQSSGKVSCDGHCETETEQYHNPNAEACVTETQIGLKNVSYLWKSFIEQLESLRANASLMILATSELPYSSLPHRIRQFFGNEIVDCRQTRPLDHRVPGFSVQLDGKFDCDRVISSFAVKLSKDVAQHFVQLIYGKSHKHENTLKEKAHDIVKGWSDAVCHTKSSTVTAPNPVPFNKYVRVKSSLMLGIATVGYQILCYPHFAELCWVTSKLKEGPSANVIGPWKRWPFNSCIVRPTNRTEKVTALTGSVNIKCKASGLVRGLVAVALSAYRGEYTSPKEVCLEVRKVSEILVKQIDYKIQVGKDSSLFFHLLSQVAYLEDIIINWARTFESLDVDTSISDTSIKICVGTLNDHPGKNDDDKLQVSSENRDGVGLGGETSREIEKNVSFSDPTNSDNGFLIADDEVAETVKEAPRSVFSNHSTPVENSLVPNDGNVQSSKEETVGDTSEMDENVESIKLPNGVKDSFDHLQADGLIDKLEIELPASTEVCNQQNVVGSSDGVFLSKDFVKNSGGDGLNVGNAFTPTNLTGGSSAACVYQCCSECFGKLHNLLLKMIKVEWECQRSNSTVEDVHEFVASFSGNLHLALNKMSQAEVSSFTKQNYEDSNCRKYFECQSCQDTDVSECKSSEKMAMECVCHADDVGSTSTVNFPQVSHGFNSTFIFRDGVLVTLDTGTDVPCHCKFAALCLCFLIEWLTMSKQISG